MLRQPITDVAIGQNELPVEAEDDKQTIFDITCKSQTESKVLNIEIQGRNDSDSFDNRSEYHVAHLLNHFIKKGMDWDDVPEAFMISVLILCMMILLMMVFLSIPCDLRMERN